MFFGGSRRPKKGRATLKATVIHPVVVVNTLFTASSVLDQIALVTSASLLVTSALLVVTRSY